MTAARSTSNDPAHFDEFAAKTSTMVHDFAAWTDEPRSLHTPTMPIFGDRDFSPLADVLETFELLPDAQLPVPRDHARRRDTTIRPSARRDHTVPRRELTATGAGKTRATGVDQCRCSTGQRGCVLAISRSRRCNFASTSGRSARHLRCVDRHWPTTTHARGSETPNRSHSRVTARRRRSGVRGFPRPPP